MSREFWGYNPELPKLAETIGDLVAFEAIKWAGHPSVLYDFNRPINPNYGFDCSGFIIWCFSQTRIPLKENIRHVSEFLDNYGMYIHYGYQQRGDLVIFPSNKGVYPRHIGIMLDKQHYIHAPGKNNTVVSINTLLPFRLDSNLHPEQIYTHSPIGFKRPSITYLRWKTELFETN